MITAALLLIIQITYLKYCATVVMTPGQGVIA